ncbi:penicillin-binding transpeptidase domain-containing protein [Tropicibacter oceani]|uniref:Penicillin-binding transpeptidase domain-containing protein n=1 Tax=Tropicibacter oceani TaxID=3058420 RepID=A0ABY8QG43_9RHOB|nr:penicillin-binding transpeptidase domain-containing protein [Tropicibacter oceani]WGW03584.1 penicillin-binding transpeptidase domain-containing protein [Tropicibacter oceani]
MRLLTLILSIGLLLAVGVLISQLFETFDTIAGRNKTWVETASVRASNSVSAQLFHSGVRHGYIYYDPDADQVKLLTKREIAHGLAREQAGIPPPEGGFLPPAVAEKLLWRDTGAGIEIRKELSLHQTRRSVVAVRDAGLSPKCGISDSDAGNCIGSPWVITLQDLAETNPNASQSAGNNEVDPSIFSGFARRTAPFPGDWSAISGPDVANSEFEMRPFRLLNDRSGTAILDIIGRNPKLEPENAHPSARFEALCVDDQENLVRLRVTPCKDLENVDDDKALAYRLRLLAGEWNEDSRLVVGSVQVSALPGELRARLRAGLGPSRTGATKPLRRRIDDRFNLACLGTNCWPELVENRQVRRVSVDLVEAELARNAALTPAVSEDPDIPEAERPVRVNDPLLENTGSGGIALSAAAHQLNLEPMIGLPGLSNGSYMNFLENLPAGLTRDQLLLTFDPSLQSIALEKSRDLLQTRTFPVQTGNVPAQFDETRKAGFVLVDLQGDPGAVRAAVSYPFFDPAMPIWDLQALATGAEGNSPASPSVWRGLDARLQPGSSIKIVSALSLIRSAIGLNEGIPDAQRSLIAQSVFGASDKTYRNEIGFAVDQTETTVRSNRQNVAPPFTFRDRGEIPFNYNQGVANSCRSQGLAAQKAAAGRNYGVCEALARSSNIFFGQMAVFENRQTINALYDSSFKPRAFTGLAQTLKALDLHSAKPLVALPEDIAVEASFVPRMEAPRLESAPGLATSDGPASFFDFHERNIAINAYGQNAFASPLTMAIAAGSIALNARIEPHIAGKVGFVPPLQGPLVPETEDAQAMFSELHLGMKAVVQSGGTGAASFGSSSGAAKAVQTRVHGKTGTATMGITDSRGQNLTTHWFVGWVDDTGGKPRYAFACAISHTSGGSPCPALTGGILGAMSEAGHL